MKIKNIILFFFSLITILCNQVLFAQNNQNARAVLTLRNIQYINVDTLQFELYLSRTSDDWLKFANGTFQFAFYPDSNNILIDTVLVDTTDLGAPDFGAGGFMPVKGYKTDFQIYPDRFSITYIGPPDYAECIDVPKSPVEILIGKYHIKTNQLIDSIRWKKEYSHYQACAYKIDHDSLFYNDQNHIRYYKDDNVPLITGNTGENSILYLVDNTNLFDSMDVVFIATYVGDLNIALEFRIRKEYKIVGYTIIRKYQDNPPNSPFDYNTPENPPVTIFTYTTASPQYNPKMISQGWNPGVTHIYNGLTDIVQYRGGAYCYQLWATFITDKGLKDSLIGEDCAEIPALIIAQAGAMPNPFDKQTTIKYQLVEDAYIRVQVWDLVGRMLDEINLIDEDTNYKLDGSGLKTAGWHSFVFKPQKISSQGLFNIIIEAVPKNPISQVENGRAVIKVQYLIENTEGQ